MDREVIGFLFANLFKQSDDRIAVHTANLIIEQSQQIFWITPTRVRGGALTAFGRNRLFVLLKSARILRQLTGFKQSLDSGYGV